jgi:hypothetical protein
MIDLFDPPIFRDVVNAEIDFELPIPPGETPLLSRSRDYAGPGHTVGQRHMR